MMINDGYIVIKEISLNSIENKLFIKKNFDGESRFAEVISVNDNSIFNVGDIIQHEKAIMLFKAESLGEGKFYILERDIHSKLVGDDIISIRDSVYIKTEKESKHTLSFKNFKFNIDSEFNPFDDDIVTRCGVVVAAPLEAINSYTDEILDVELKPGDIVYTHHFLTHDDNEAVINGEKVYQIRYEDCYCRVRDGKLKMLNEWNLIEPIKEKEEDFRIGRVITKVDLSHDSSKGVLKNICSKMKNLGVKINDTIYFKKNRDYFITVGDKKYFRVNTRDIVATKLN